MAKLKEEGYSILYTDEMMVSSKVWQKEAWSRKNEPMTIDMRQANIVPIASLASISLE